MDQEITVSNPNELTEVKKAPSRPDTLYRGYTVHPESLSLDLFTKPLVPGS